MLSLHHSDQTPPIPQNYPVHHQQQGGGGFGNTRSGCLQQQQLIQNSSDLGRVYQAAVAAGIPTSALEAALASAGGGQQQHNFARNENQHQAMSLELLRRLAQQGQKDDGTWFLDDPYQR
jgi:hypothetical protein